MTRSVRDAITAHEILAARRVTAGNAPLSAYRLAVVKNLFFDGIEPAVATAFERSLKALRAAGARIVEIELPELAELGAINATGGFSAADAMFAPVINRFDVYDLVTSSETLSYMAAVKAHPAWVKWEEAARAEPWIVPHDEV